MGCRSRVEQHRVQGSSPLAVTATLTTQVVADVASDEVLLLGMGPWLAADSDSGILPGRRWHAAPSVVSQVEGVIRFCADTTLSDLLDCHDLALRADLSVRAHGGHYGEVVARLVGMAVSSPALFPPVLIAVSGLPPVTDEAIASAVSARLPALAEDFDLGSAMLSLAAVRPACVAICPVDN